MKDRAIQSVSVTHGETSMSWHIPSFIHSFIHIKHLYSASSRKLLRSAPNTSTVKQSSPKVRKNASERVLLKMRSYANRFRLHEIYIHIVLHCSYTFIKRFSQCTPIRSTSTYMPRWRRCSGIAEQLCNCLRRGSNPMCLRHL